MADEQSPPRKLRRSSRVRQPTPKASEAGPSESSDSSPGNQEPASRKRKLTTAETSQSPSAPVNTPSKKAKTIISRKETGTSPEKNPESTSSTKSTGKQPIRLTLRHKVPRTSEAPESSKKRAREPAETPEAAGPAKKLRVNLPKRASSSFPSPSQDTELTQSTVKPPAKGMFRTKTSSRVPAPRGSANDEPTSQPASKITLNFPSTTATPTGKAKASSSRPSRQGLRSNVAEQSSSNVSPETHPRGTNTEAAPAVNIRVSKVCESCAKEQPTAMFLPQPPNQDSVSARCFTCRQKDTIKKIDLRVRKLNRVKRQFQCIDEIWTAIQSFRTWLFETHGFILSDDLCEAIMTDVKTHPGLADATANEATLPTLRDRDDETMSYDSNDMPTPPRLTPSPGKVREYDHRPPHLHSTMIIDLANSLLETSLALRNSPPADENHIRFVLGEMYRQPIANVFSWLDLLMPQRREMLDDLMARWGNMDENDKEAALTLMHFARRYPGN